nr:hypothetical protein [Carnobacterium maltaromaticum]
MDGLIFDTETLYYRSMQEVADRLGINIILNLLGHQTKSCTKIYIAILKMMKKLRLSLQIAVLV